MTPLKRGMTIGVAALGVLAGCSDPGFRGVPSVRTASSVEVSACRLISHISMQPSVYGPVLGGQGVSYARNKVLQSAAADGANTVVFDQVEPGAEVYEVRGSAYAC